MQYWAILADRFRDRWRTVRAQTPKCDADLRTLFHFHWKSRFHVSLVHWNVNKFELVLDTFISNLKLLKWILNINNKRKLEISRWLKLNRGSGWATKMFIRFLTDKHKVQLRRLSSFRFRQGILHDWLCWTPTPLDINLRAVLATIRIFLRLVQIIFSANFRIYNKLPL